MPVIEEVEQISVIYLLLHVFLFSILYRYIKHTKSLSEATGFTLRFHEGKDVTLTNGALDVTHDKAVLVVKELDTDLSNLATGAGAANDLHHNSKLDGGILQVGKMRDGLVMSVFVLKESPGNSLPL